MAVEIVSERDVRPECQPDQETALTWAFSLNWQYCRPLLKRVLPPSFHQDVRRMRNRLQPVHRQYPPIPLRIPRHYANVPWPSSSYAPTVSLVTPSFNQGRFLERTLRSVLTQSYPRLEYVLQDGNSDDDTQRILQRYQQSLAYVESGNDGGQANAINRGFRRTTGDIMAWLNADDVLLPGTVPYVVNFFSNHSEIDVVYGHRICLDEHDQEIGRWILPPHDNAILPWANYVPQETLFWRRELWENVGGLDESYHFALDWELLLRFQRAGARFARLPRFLGGFRVHSAQKTTVLAELGQREAQRLHAHYHGRPVPWLEVRYHVRRYLARTAGLYLLHNMGLLRL